MRDVARAHSISFVSAENGLLCNTNMLKCCIKTHSIFATSDSSGKKGPDAATRLFKVNDVLKLRGSALPRAGCFVCIHLTRKNHRFTLAGSVLTHVKFVIKFCLLKTKFVRVRQSHDWKF